MYFSKCYFIEMTSFTIAVHFDRYADMYCWVPPPASGHQEPELSRWGRNVWNEEVKKYIRDSLMCPAWAVQIFRAFLQSCMLPIDSLQPPQWVWVLLMLCLYSVYLPPLCSGAIRFWMSLAKRWLWQLSNTNHLNIDFDLSFSEIPMIILMEMTSDINKRKMSTAIH